jgi:predicted transcriptional regulator
MYQSLKEYLIAHDLSANQFHLLSKISLPTIYKVLNGDPIRKDTLHKLMKACKKQLDMKAFSLVADSQ